MDHGKASCLACSVAHARPGVLNCDVFFRLTRAISSKMSTITKTGNAGINHLSLISCKAGCHKLKREYKCMATSLTLNQNILYHSTSHVYTRKAPIQNSRQEAPGLSPSHWGRRGRCYYRMHDSLELTHEA